MLAVILKILQITGIVLLCILGFILVMLILILVMPVKYSINVSADPGEKLKARLKVTYFFGIVRALAEYEEVFEVNAKVFWFKIFSMKIPDKEADEEISLDDLDEALDEEFPDDEFYSDGSGDECSTEEISSNEASTNAASQDEDSVSNPDEAIPNEPEELPDDEEELTFEPADEMSDDTDESFSDEDEEGPFAKLKYKFEEICDKIDKVKSEIRYYYNIYNSNEGKNALRKTGKHLKKIFRKLLPRKITANVTYGFSSPDLTGKVYGVYCIMADRFSRDSVVTPDFDREVFEGTVKAKGYFNIWGILVNLIAIALNTDAIKIFRSVRRHLKKKDTAPSEENGKAA